MFQLISALTDAQKGILAVVGVAAGVGAIAGGVGGGVMARRHVRSLQPATPAPAAQPTQGPVAKAEPPVDLGLGTAA